MQRLSYLLKARVALLDSLLMMRAQTTSRSQQGLLDELIAEVSNGHTLAQSLEKHCVSWGGYSLTVIRIGEMAGVLSENLHHLHLDLQKKEEMHRKFIGSLFYPAIIVGTTLGVSALLTIYLFPKVLPIIMSLKLDLPQSTKLLIVIHKYIKEWGATMLGVLIIGSACIIGMMKIEKIKYQVDKLILHIPLFGLLVQTYEVGVICRTLGLLLKSEIPLVSALEIVKDASTNLAYKEAVSAMAKRVNQGEALAQCLAYSPLLFPPLVSQLVAIGEHTGNLGETLLSLTDMYEGELEGISKILAHALEPVLMVILGAIIGFVAIAIITPFYAITQQLHR